MNKKYFPFIALIAAFLLFIWIKKNQRGSGNKPPVQVESGTPQPFVRDTTNIIYSKHAMCRMECRNIDESEVKEILLQGELNYSRIEDGSKGKSYPLEGMTHDRQHVRIVFAPHEDNIVVVTVIDLNKEWECHCE